MLLELLLVVVSLLLLFVGAESLVRGSSSLALRMGMSPLVVGLTVVAFGTSAPELLVSLKAGFAGKGDIAAGNVVGSNIFNLAVILGLTALICPIPVKMQLIKADVPVMILVSATVPLLFWDGVLSRSEAAPLVAGIVVYVLVNVYWARKQTTPALAAEFEEGVPKRTTHWLADAGFVCLGLGVLIFGSRLLVDNTVEVARFLGVSEAVIALTIIAAGTSMPELATSVVAALRKEPDIAIGNVVGSNIFNVLAILGISGLAVPLTAPGIHSVDHAVMIGLSVVILPFFWSGLVVRRLEGLVLLAAYVGYLAWIWPK
ncbi:MAG TPA: calcium/sodium antiporter [Verrucomicrobiales bacterium]|nr:calcium/sodium antiporter [Verrucomicrobiales bacterium]